MRVGINLNWVDKYFFKNIAWLLIICSTILIILFNFGRFPNENQSITRRIRTVLIEYDAFETATYYKYVNRRLVKDKVVDRNGNLIENYQYDEAGNLRKVQLRNIRDGLWIELQKADISTDVSDISWDIYVNGDRIGDVIYTQSEKDPEVVHLIQMYIKPEFQTRGIGLTVINWVMKDALFLWKSNKFLTITDNPRMVSIMKKISLQNSLKYTTQSMPQGVWNELSDYVKLLEDCSGFYITGIEDRGTPRKVVLMKGKVVQSEYELLPKNTTIDRLNVIEKWRLTLDGEIIGQIKFFNYPAYLRGITQPIGMFINERSEIVLYQGDRIIEL